MLVEVLGFEISAVYPPVCILKSPKNKIKDPGTNLRYFKFSIIFIIRLQETLKNHGME